MVLPAEVLYFPQGAQSFTRSLAEFSYGNSAKPCVNLCALCGKLYLCKAKWQTIIFKRNGLGVKFIPYFNTRISNHFF